MPRTYVQRARAESAERTRERLLDAARAAVLAEGRLELGVGEIAAAARVARSTVYTAFGSRAGLLAALADQTLHRAGVDLVIAEYRNADPVVALERSLVASCRMYAADHRVFRRLLMLGEVDPEAAEPLSRSQHDRAFGMADLSGRLAQQGRLRDGVTPDHAANVLWVVTSFWTFDECFSGRGLDADATAAVLLDMARSTILADVPAPTKAKGKRTPRAPAS